MTLEGIIQAALHAAKPPPAPVEPSPEMVAAKAAQMVQRGYKPHDIPAFKALATWAAGTRRRGLLLSGRAGCGKTYFFTSVLRPRHFNTASRVVESWLNSNGHYNECFWLSAFRCWQSLGHLECSITIDDLGQEPVANHYGSRVEVLDRLLCERSEAWKRDNRIITNITTNLSPEELDERYGRRVTDRIREMCIHVPFTCSSNR